MCFVSSALSINVNSPFASILQLWQITGIIAIIVKRFGSSLFACRLLLLLALMEIRYLQVFFTCNMLLELMFSLFFWVDLLVDFFTSTNKSTAYFLQYAQKKKASTIIRLSMLLLSRGDWIRTSDHTPPRQLW